MIDEFLEEEHNNFINSEDYIEMIKDLINYQ